MNPFVTLCTGFVFGTSLCAIREAIKDRDFCGVFCYGVFLLSSVVATVMEFTR